MKEVSSTDLVLLKPHDGITAELFDTRNKVAFKRKIHYVGTAHQKMAAVIYRKSWMLLCCAGHVVKGKNGW